MPKSHICDSWLCGPKASSNYLKTTTIFITFIFCLLSNTIKHYPQNASDQPLKTWSKLKTLDSNFDGLAKRMRRTYISTMSKVQRAEPLVSMPELTGAELTGACPN